MTLLSKLGRIGASALIGTGIFSSIARADEAEVQALQNKITHVDTQKAKLEKELNDAKERDAKEKEAAENRLGVVRSRVEYISQGTKNEGTNTNLTKYTLGVSPGKSDPKSPFTKFDEVFRVYETEGELAGGRFDDTQVNLRLNLPSLDSAFIFYGQEGSHQFNDRGTASEGIGAQYIFDNDKLHLSLMADQRTDDKWEVRYQDVTIPKELTGSEEDTTLTIPYRAEWEEEFTHIGAYVDYEFDKWIVGAGFDRVDSPSGTENSALIKARFFPTENDQFGVAFHTSNDGTSSTNTVAGVYGHYGKDLKWGSRAIGIYSWNNDTDSHNLELKLRINQNPTYHRDFPFDWPTNNRIDDGGQFAKNQPSLPFNLENYDPHYHTSKGAFGEVKLNLGDNVGVVNGSFSAEAGYKWTPWRDSQIAASGIFKHEFTAGDLTDIQARDTIGGKLHFQKGRYEVQFKADQTLGEDPSTSVYGSVQVQIGVPKPRVADLYKHKSQDKE